jgi:2-polyprenyl-3-methyl-5-hydroxy-6-metoxy-1,4-benzoquinol methylase
MTKECLICGEDSTFFLEQQSYSFYKCTNCDFFFVDPMPTDEELSLVYSPKANYQSHKVNKDYTKENNFKYTRIFKELDKYTLGERKVLDVGASDGEFLYYAKKEDYKVSGVEPNKTTADIANSRGLNVFCGFLSDSSFDKNSFNVLRLGDVLEHSNTPHKLLDECSSFLAVGGLLVISIPNMDSNWARSTLYLNKSFRLPWSVLTPPHHLLYFSKNNLDMLLNKKGFTIVDSWYHRPPTLKYELGSTHLFGAWKKQKNIINLWRFIIGFSSYSLFYFFDYLGTPFKSKDFGMMCVYRKDA